MQVLYRILDAVALQNVRRLRQQTPTLHSRLSAPASKLNSRRIKDTSEDPEEDFCEKDKKRREEKRKKKKNPALHLSLLLSAQNIL